MLLESKSKQKQGYDSSQAQCPFHLKIGQIQSEIAESMNSILTLTLV